MNTAQGTLQVTDEQIIHLGLQVYCSPGLKEYLHSPVMSLLARTIERTVSILCAHGSVDIWVCVVYVWWCVVVVFEYMCVCLCVACVDMCT